MTIWLPNLEGRTGPRYQAIASAIVEAIEKGELPQGTRLPPQRDLAWKLGVTVGTVTRAYMLAEQRGLLSGEVGRGTFVKRAGFTGGNGAVLRRPSTLAIDLSRNVPGNSALATAVREGLNALSQTEGIANALLYMPSAGHADHRATGAQWLSRVGLNVTPDQVLVTCGAQQGLSAVMGTMVGPGETALTEALTYCGLMDAARLFRSRLDGVAMDAEGMRADALDEAVKRTGARIVFITPTVHNPTAATMSAARRMEIAAVARKHDLTIVEDDVYGFIPEDRPPPIATYAPERTIFVGSASKSIAPGLRVGWIACPPALVEPLTDAIHSMNVSLPALPGELLRLWVADGTADRLSAFLRTDTAARHRIADEVLAGFTMWRAPTSFHMLLEVPEPWTGETFAMAAREKNLLVVPASTFAVTRGVAPPAVRVSLTALDSHDDLRAALGTLRNLAMSAPRARRAVI